MADTYTTEAIACGLSDVAGWLENEGGRDKHARTIRLGVERLRELGAAGGEGEKRYPYSAAVQWPHWRCPDCKGMAYVYVGEWKADRSINSSPLIRCVNCKSVFDTRPHAAPSHPGEADRVGLGELAARFEVKNKQAIIKIITDEIFGGFAAIGYPGLIEKAADAILGRADAAGEADTSGVEADDKARLVEYLRELERLGAAATQEMLSVSSVRRRYDEPSCVIVNTPSCAGLFALATGVRGEAALQSLADAKFLVGLWNAYRSGKLVPASLAALGTREGSGGASPVGPAGQTCLDAAAAIEGIAQELDAYGRTAQGHMLRQALDVLLDVQSDEQLPPADAGTKRSVDRAWARFQAAAQGTEAEGRNTAGGSVHEGPVGKADAPSPPTSPQAPNTLSEVADLRSRATAAEDTLRDREARIDALENALDAADYLADRYCAAWQGKTVRDLAEAEASYGSASRALARLTIAQANAALAQPDPSQEPGTGGERDA
ncbi:hypothetical protein [Methylobacterium sp. WL7]|uniref:hypothetical protein n=1 Tax=Methylobacterium sp. WL7 TaxID=2603900 RepID=UPI0011C6FB44|nr:hypothetical protein [Methylobacterium sp. WL7]TXN39153.1 hypothetical protein FV233_28430 [Methylobacterium sp. WL7]